MSVTQELHGVYICEGVTTMDVPHKVLQAGGKTYFVGRYPEGDYCIHEWNPRIQDGYARRHVTFLLEDGSFRTVRGPYSKAGLFDFGAAALVAVGLNQEDIGRKAYRLTIGRDIVKAAWGSAKAEIVHDEPSFVLGDWRERVRPEWAGLEIRVNIRGGAVFSTVDEVLGKRNGGAE